MKRKTKSFFEIKINNITVGYVINLFCYSNNEYESDMITTEFIPYGVIKEIPAVKLSNEFPIYLEKQILGSKQDEQQSLESVRGIVLNLKDLNYELIKHRQAFDIKLNINDK